MLLDLRHQIGEGLGGVGRAGALGKREIGKPGRAQRQIDRKRQQRQSDQRQYGRGAPQPRARFRRRIAGPVGDRQQPAADLDPRGFGLSASNQASCDIALDFGELVLVDHRFVGLGPVSSRLVTAGRPRAAEPERQQHGEHRCRRHQREHEP